MKYIQSIERIIEKDKSILMEKRGFPSVGCRPDGMEFSSSVQKIASAWYIYDTELNNLSIANDDSVESLNLGGGNPACTPAFPLCIDSLRDMLDRTDLYKYPPAAGDEDARECIAKYLNKEGFSNLSFKNVIITVSTTHAFSMILDVIARPYDVILMTGPNYGLFTFFPERMNACVEILELSESDNYHVNPEKLDLKIKSINERLKNEYCGKLDYVPQVVAFLNQNPHNPTGKVMGKKEIDLLESIASVCLSNGTFIIDDLIYRDITFDKTNTAIPIGTLSKYFSNTISLFGLSKCYGLASMRAGFVAADALVISALRNKLFHMMDSAPILQATALTGAFNDSDKRYVEYDKYFSEVNTEYEYRYYLLKALVDGIDSLDNISPINVSNDFKSLIYDDISKVVSNDVLNYVLEGIPDVNMLKGLIPDGGFFALIDFSKLRGRKYMEYNILSERDLLMYLYENNKIKYIMGESISFPNEDMIVGRVTYALERVDLIKIFAKMNMSIRKLK